MNDETLKILTNEEVIAVSQDDAGIQGHKMNVMGTDEIWAGPMANGDMAVILLNRGKTRSSITVTWSDFGAAYAERVSKRGIGVRINFFLSPFYLIKHNMAYRIAGNNGSNYIWRFAPCSSFYFNLVNLLIFLK